MDTKTISIYIFFHKFITQYLFPYKYTLITEVSSYLINLIFFSYLFIYIKCGGILLEYNKTMQLAGHLDNTIIYTIYNGRLLQ